MNDVVMIQQAVEAIAARDADVAIDCLEQVLRQHPDHIVALINLGHVRLLNCELPQAAPLYERAFALDPGSAEVRLGMAKLRLAQNRPEDAAPLLDEVPGIPFTREQRSEVLHLRGLESSMREDHAAAEAAFRAAITLRPEQPLYYFSLHALYERTQRPDAAVDVLEQLAGLNPGYTETWFRLLTALATTYDAERFRRCCDAMLAANPGQLGLYNLAARLYLVQKQYAYAFLACREAVTHEPDFDRSQYTALARVETLA